MPVLSLTVVRVIGEVVTINCPYGRAEFRCARTRHESALIYTATLFRTTRVLSLPEWMAIPVEPKKVSGQRGGLPTKILLCGAAMMVSIRKFLMTRGTVRQTRLRQQYLYLKPCPLWGWIVFLCVASFFLKKRYTVNSDFFLLSDVPLII